MLEGLTKRTGILGEVGGDVLDGGLEPVPTIPESAPGRAADQHVVGPQAMRRRQASSLVGALSVAASTVSPWAAHPAVLGEGLAAPEAPVKR